MSVAERHAAWLDLHDTGKWSYARIGRLSAVTARAVRMAVTSLRKAKASGSKGHPSYLDEGTRRSIEAKFRGNSEVQQWLLEQRRPLD